MKKALLLAVMSASLMSTTGCAAKKRVKALEAELARCKAMNLQLKRGELTKEQEYELASSTCTACEAETAAQ